MARQTRSYMDEPPTRFEKWSWRRALPGDTWNQMAITGYRGWMARDDRNDPIGMVCAHVNDKKDDEPLECNKLAIILDDCVSGAFYWRSWIPNQPGPFLRRGEAYRSGFWFQFHEDLHRAIDVAKQNNITIIEISDISEDSKAIAPHCK